MHRRHYSIIIAQDMEMEVQSLCLHAHAAFQYIQCYGSSADSLGGTSVVVLFQYIQCYGSSFVARCISVGESYFNTSNVTVHRISRNSYTGCWAYFNTSNVTVHPRLIFQPSKRSWFQYIQCYGSSESFANKILFRFYFNTSNVTVHPNIGRLCRVY